MKKNEIMKLPNKLFRWDAFALFLLFIGVTHSSTAQEVSEEIEIASERLRLSYVDPLRCVELLKLYGVNVGSPSLAVDRTKLPVVVPMPETKFHETIPDHTKVFPKTETDPINEILLFYDEQKPERLGRFEDYSRTDRFACKKNND